ncbi:hypothetical protein LQ772_15865 [Frateuria edaphi]|uniref:hypothetical protein n=1 Tax=Frateuria edaphi TaxID=2898793 RepID=UPI001E4462CD|nr:hypothetical protein [Frateuria edaphi]UGB45434.1 hypothetical protein LQ772_15865 [Frateuria edaphi]
MDTIDVLVDVVQAQAWPVDDLRMLPMARTNASAKHPLSGYCLSVSFHWANLFYTLEPSVGTSTGPADAPLPFEDLMAEFSTYVLAAQSSIEPGAYLAFCQSWWSSGQLPSRAPYTSRRLASRVAAASRAMRQITLAEHGELFSYLADRTAGDPLYERVDSAQRLGWDEDNERVIDAIARLLEDVRLGWSRSPGPPRRSSTGKATSRKVVHRNFRDGFVRVSEQEAILLKDTTEEGWAFEYMLVAPETMEGATRERLQELIDATPVSDKGEESNGGAPDEDDSSASEDLKERARNEAEIRLDGSEWIPAEEAAGNDGLEAIRLDTSEDAPAVTSTGTSSRAAAEHIRRHHFAHRLAKNRLLLNEAQQLLAALREEPAESDDREVLMGVHACLALGRPIHEIVSKLCIHEGGARLGLNPEEIHYMCESRQWIVPCPAPAWQELDRDTDERIQWPQMWLNDQTGFGALLRHFGLATDGRPLQKLTVNRKRAANGFLARALPKADTTLEQCANFLFHQILATSQGDLGLACLITGQRHSHGSSVGHYANYRPQTVWRAYRRAWAGSSVVPPAAAYPIDEAQGGYGAKRVPTTEAVRRLLATLRSQAASGQDPQSCNAYVAYTLAGLVLGLGMRPVVEPRITDVAESFGKKLFLSLIDKARTDYHRRINAIPARLAKHLLHYEVFGSGTRQCLLTSEDSPLFPYIEPGTGARVCFRPSHLQAIAAPHFALELYALRRYARTHLREARGVHAEDLDAYMGHWLHRVSPHDPLSTYPMRRLAELAEGPVERMLDAVGFEPLKPKA